MRCFVKPSAGVESRIEDRFRHSAIASQLTSQTARAMGDAIRFGRKARDALEQPMKVIRAHAWIPREGGQTQRCLGRLNPPADLRHECGMALRQSALARLTTPARSEARFFGSFLGCAEVDVFPFWPPRGEGRPAINAGCFDGVEKLPVGLPVPV